MPMDKVSGDKTVLPRLKYKPAAYHPMSPDCSIDDGRFILLGSFPPIRSPFSLFIATVLCYNPRINDPNPMDNLMILQSRCLCYEYVKNTAFITTRNTY